MRPGQTKLKETAPKNSHRVSKCNARMFHRNISISQLSCQQSNVNVGTAFFWILYLIWNSILTYSSLIGLDFLIWLNWVFCSPRVTSRNYGQLVGGLYFTTISQNSKCIFPKLDDLWQKRVKFRFTMQLRWLHIDWYWRFLEFLLPRATQIFDKSTQLWYYFKWAFYWAPFLQFRNWAPNRWRLILVSYRRPPS